MTDDRTKARPEHVGNILESVLDRTGLSARAREREVLATWPEIAGERVARHVRAVDIENGVLTLETEHAAWKQEMMLLFPTLIEKYNARHGDGTVREVRWRRGGPR